MGSYSIYHIIKRPQTNILLFCSVCLFIFLLTPIDSSVLEDVGKSVQTLQSRITDLRRIKQSVSNELRLIERERNKILKEKASLLSRNEKILNQIASSKVVLKQLELDISANKRQKVEQSCNSDQLSPILFSPLESVNLIKYSDVKNDYYGKQYNEAFDRLTINLTSDPDSMIDLSQCPLSKPFRFGAPDSLWFGEDYNRIVRSHPEFTASSDVCLNISLLLDKSGDNHVLEGRNKLFIVIGNGSLPRMTDAMVASSQFSRNTFRHRFDIVIPNVLFSSDNYNRIIGSMPPHSPLERKYFASYFGHSVIHGSPEYEMTQDKQNLNVLEKTLQTLHRSSLDEKFLFLYDCNADISGRCYEQREANVGNSIFLILIPNPSFDIDSNTNELLLSALIRGTIPVIIGKKLMSLPFEEVVDWRRAAIIIPSGRLPELIFILKSYSPSDIYSLKYHGRRIFERHFATLKQIFTTIIDLVRIERFGHLPPAVEDIKTMVHIPSGGLNLDIDCTTDVCREGKTDSMMSMLSSDILGPREHPFASPKFRRNYSLILNHAYDLWNDPLHTPSYLFPSLPDEPVAPSEYKFINSDQGYRPIAGGQGGSGWEFSRALGGDYPNEQFTIVLLTYERKVLLARTLERLKGMAYLNKVIVIWNGINQKPTQDTIWPDIGVPLELVKVPRNSLNNRFLPLDSIETDAIFSMDDDSPLRPDEIVFAFRVWRQSRSQIVGFPGRYHAWDDSQNTWLYNSNHSCELSMVLTGGAFYHKYYAYMYTYFMPESIRSIVDRFMNCEDIAMNFLVAHLTRKPPIKVTSRWTFHCADCLSSLSEDDSHFRERHECLNSFASIYGYMPLLNTQHRSDSILFKTRLPKDKQKCFKFV